MVSERIDDSSHSPAVLVADRRHYFRSCCKSPFECRVWIFYDHQHPHRATAQRVGAEVGMFGRLVRDPEFGSSQRQPGDHLSALVIDAEQLASSKRRFVELNRSRPISNREHRNHRESLILRHRLSSPWTIDDRRSPPHPVACDLRRHVRPVRNNSVDAPLQKPPNIVRFVHRPHLHGQPGFVRQLHESRRHDAR